MSRIALALLAIGVTLGPLAKGQATEFSVYAAGSLRAPLTEIAEHYALASGNRALLTFGASGLLRDRISSGERADVFASANMEHPQSLLIAGWTTRVQRFARNAMCLLASPQVPVSTVSALDVMLDPSVVLATSTPKADPSGDYAWEVFHNAAGVRPGAFVTLSTKARQLTGGPRSPAPPSRGSVYGALIASGDADVALTYCTNAELAHQDDAALRVVRLPANLAVAADYGVAAHSGSSPAAQGFVDYLRGAAGQRVLAAYGFDPA